MKHFWIFYLFAIAYIYADDSFSDEPPPRDTDPKDMHVHREFQFFISLDYTLWTARQDGMLSTLGAYGRDIPSRTTGMTYPKWYWQSGVKVAIGMAQDQDDWDIALQYTWFYNRGNPLSPDFSFPVGNLNQGTVPAWFFATSILGNSDQVKRSLSLWDNQFNRLDLTMYRSLFKEKNYEYGGFLGLLSWWEEQSFKIVYEVGSTSTTKNSIDAQQDAGGIGPYGGGEFAAYPFLQTDTHAGFFVDWGVALLWSRFSAKMHVESLQFVDQSVREIFNKNAIWITAPMIEVCLGIRGVFWLSEKTNCIVQAGWEMQAWFDHNHMFSNYICRGPGVSNALYTMGGLTVKLLMGF